VRPPRPSGLSVRRGFSRSTCMYLPRGGQQHLHVPAPWRSGGCPASTEYSVEQRFHVSARVRCIYLALLRSEEVPRCASTSPAPAAPYRHCSPGHGPTGHGPRIPRRLLLPTGHAHGSAWAPASYPWAPLLCYAICIASMGPQSIIVSMGYDVSNRPPFTEYAILPAIDLLSPNMLFPAIDSRSPPPPCKPPASYSPPPPARLRHHARCPAHA
jgi:hypothetical protein